MSIAAPAVAGLISYFYSSPHLDVITQRWKDKGGSNLDWARTVKEYVIELSYERIPGQDGGPVNVVYNGEDPVASCPVPGSSGSGVNPRQTDESENFKGCQNYYRIFPRTGTSWDLVEAFMERLKKETDEKTLRIHGSVISKSPEKRFVIYWAQWLTSDQAEGYKADPIVS
jgi:hypothetical protein